MNRRLLRSLNWYVALPAWLRSVHPCRSRSQPRAQIQSQTATGQTFGNYFEKNGKRLFPLE